MNKERIEQLALEVAVGYAKERTGMDNDAPLVDEYYKEYAARFLARVDAERAKEGPVARVDFNRMKSLEWLIEPDDILNTDDLLYLHPQHIPEGYKLTHKNLGEVVVTAECLYLQLQNPDPTSFFVKHSGEVKEVSSAMLAAAPEVKP